MIDFQTCKDQELDDKFSKLHEELVNKVIAWCKENNVRCDDFHLGIDGMLASIDYGSWTPGTDSSCTLKTESHDKDPFLYEI